MLLPRFSRYNSLLRFLKVLIFRRFPLLSAAFCAVLVISSLFVITPKYVAWKRFRMKSEEFLYDPSLLTIHCNPGRLGNQMFLYATLYGLARLNHRTPYTPHCNMVHLIPHFQVTMDEIDVLPNEMISEHKLIGYLRPEDKRISSDKNILGGNAFPTSYTFLHHVRKDIIKEFRFKNHLKAYANAVLSSFNVGPSTVYIGVHVRKTDYCGWLANYNGTEVNVEYFIKAMKYFRDKYNNVLFVVVTDDRLWCKQNLAMLPDVSIAPKPPDPAYDLAILAHCNHTIISYGSFGFWGAYLAGGEAVYFSDYLSPHSSFLHEMPYNITYLPGWTAISTVKAEFWETYVPDKPHCYKWFWEQIMDWFKD